MTYDVQRWSLVVPKPLYKSANGQYVLAADAEAHERAAVEAAVAAYKTAAESAVRAHDLGREQAIRDCIAALEERWSESWCGRNYASCTDPDHACRYRRLDVAALRALLDGE